MKTIRRLLVLLPLVLFLSSCASMKPGILAPEFPQGAKWLDHNVSGWPVTTKLSAYVEWPRVVKMEYDKAAKWPATKGVDGNCNANWWIIFERDGKWYVSTWEWQKVGATVKRNLKTPMGDHVGLNPPVHRNWNPQKGERVGFFVSGKVRQQRVGNVQPNVRERSDVVWLAWK